ncbi:hypothetical protein ACHHYP_10892 [Achlya hypogyna]|uniref:Uncharacterized protein n=1 Tax=Achlya hypogyna TaxID=1202772 RepID=A0A1V9ZHN5_ACHHY|nr:hypothetical protein ACHHYP_10892 [Achlya hypogyna]
MGIYAHNYQDPWAIFLDQFVAHALVRQSHADILSLALTSRSLYAHLAASTAFRFLRLLHERNRTAIVDDRNLRFVVHTEVPTTCGITGKGFGVYVFTSDPARIRTPAPGYLKELHAEIWRLATAMRWTHLEASCAIGRIHNCACEGYFQPRFKVRLGAMTACTVEKHPTERHAYIVQEATPRWLLGSDMAWDQVFSVVDFRRVATTPDSDWWHRQHSAVRPLAPAFGALLDEWMEAECPVVFQTTGTSFNLAPFHAEYTAELFVSQHEKGRGLDADDAMDYSDEEMTDEDMDD